MLGDVGTAPRAKRDALPMRTVRRGGRFYVNRYDRLLTSRVPLGADILAPVPLTLYPLDKSATENGTSPRKARPKRDVPSIRTIRREGFVVRKLLPMTDPPAGCCGQVPG